jgi:hypothetical protein
VAFERCTLSWYAEKIEYLSRRLGLQVSHEAGHISAEVSGSSSFLKSLAVFLSALEAAPLRQLLPASEQGKPAIPSSGSPKLQSSSVSSQAAGFQEHNRAQHKSGSFASSGRLSTSHLAADLPLQPAPKMRRSRHKRRV